MEQLIQSRHQRIKWKHAEPNCPPLHRPPHSSEGCSGRTTKLSSNFSTQSHKKSSCSLWICLHSPAPSGGPAGSPQAPGAEEPPCRGMTSAEAVGPFYHDCRSTYFHPSDGLESTGKYNPVLSLGHYFSISRSPRWVFFCNLSSFGHYT